MNQRWYFYDLATGIFTGAVFNGDAEAAAEQVAHLGTGTAARVGPLDPLAQRVDLATGDLVPWQPPAPQDTAYTSWSWADGIKRWLPVRTPAAVAMDVRAERDRRLAQCDWVTVRAAELGEPVPSAWAAYRQALRDLPLQPGFPGNPEWPAEPAEGA